MTTAEDAHLLISKYRSEQTLLRVSLILRDKSVNMRLTARALAEEEGFEQLTLVAPNGDHCLVLLHDCRFVYGEPREVSDPVVRAASEAKFEGLLTVLLPSGELLYIMELR